MILLNFLSYLSNLFNISFFIWHVQVILADRSLRAWKLYNSQEKKDKVKKTQKDVMWKKVNGWLTEYSDQKKHLKYK